MIANAKWEYRTDEEWLRHVLVRDGVDLGRVVKQDNQTWAWHVFEGQVTRWHGYSQTKQLAMAAVVEVVSKREKVKP